MVGQYKFQVLFSSCLVVFTLTSWQIESFVSSSKRRFCPHNQDLSSLILYSKRRSTPSTSSSSSFEVENQGPIMEIPNKGELEGLFQAAQRTCEPMGAENSEGAHDAFRYEWGRWVDDASMEALMERVNEIQLCPGAFDTLMAEGGNDDNDDNNNDKDSDDNIPLGRRLRVAGGEHWDCILHILPKDAEYCGRWPTGAWAIVRSLTGVAEISMLRGPNRDGLYTKATKKALRGGGDGTLSGGTAGGGEDCIKYVGGALRSYSGKSGKTSLLEVVVRPPIGKEQLDGDGQDSTKMEQLESPKDILQVVLPGSDIEEETDEADSESTETADTDRSNDGPSHLGEKLGMNFEKVGGLDDQLDDIVRRVLASRANPEAARRLGVNHVRGILLSGPPGCGKTLLARELSQMLGAREPQIVNGPEILDKFVGEAEKNIRALFAPAEIEYNQVGDQSALHVIILDEMDAIARKRGSVTGDTTGVRDSVVNQLLAKMDGVKEANNILVVGLTNRPELLDPALLRPGRLEVQLRVELPDAKGRRDILRIHTRRMNQAGGLSSEARNMLENLENGFPAKTEYFTGAELAGLVRSAASFALARTVESDESDEDAGVVNVADLEQALKEVRPVLGKQDEVLEMRYPNGISPCSSSMRRILRDLERFTSTPRVTQATSSTAKPKLQSLLLVGSGYKGGTGVTALASFSAAQASTRGEANYVRLVTSLDLLSLSSSGDESARAAALVDKFGEAGEMSNALLVLDDIDQICSGSGPSGYSSVMLATLRALLRSPPANPGSTAKAGGESPAQKTNDGQNNKGRTFRILATTSRTDAACSILNEIFDETLVVPLLSDVESVEQVLKDGSTASGIIAPEPRILAEMMIDRLGSVGVKSVLRLLERTVAGAGTGNGIALGEWQAQVLSGILEDSAGDEAVAQNVCEVN